MFSVEVLGEGVDVPDVDTVLLLRPTAVSDGVHAAARPRTAARAGKSSLTVIDLIGQQHREFRFEDRLRAILDPRRGTIVEQVEREFPFLPAGCTVDLDRQSQEIILDNLRSAVRRSRWATLVADLRSEPRRASARRVPRATMTTDSKTSTRAVAPGRAQAGRRPQDAALSTREFERQTLGH